jgi:hypothetical protein
MSDISDKNGYPICKGDLIRTFYFTGARGKKHYLYHTIVEENGHLMMVPTSHLEPTLVNRGGKCALKAVAQSNDMEIISEHDPREIVIWHERPKINRASRGGK